MLQCSNDLDCGAAGTGLRCSAGACIADPSTTSTTLDGGAHVTADGASDAQSGCWVEPDASAFADCCDDGRVLALSNPRIVSGRIAPGESANAEITLTNTNPYLDFSYAGAIMTSLTLGVTVTEWAIRDYALPPLQTSDLPFAIQVASTVSHGITAQFLATPSFYAFNSQCVSGPTLQFEFTVE